MKNKYLIKKISVLITVALTIMSCNDFLDIQPKNVPVDETFWKTEGDANTAILGAYYRLRSHLKFAGGDLPYFALGDSPTQIFSDDSQWSKNPFTGKYQNDGTNYYLSSWQRFYEVILSSNLVIENVPQMPESVFSDGSKGRDSYLGEALFLRAFTYFFMVRIWKTVPLVTTAMTDASQAVYDVAAASEEEILNQCVDDLTTILEKKYLTWGKTAGKKNTRANNASVNALLAHIYMWRTRPNQTTVDKTNFTKAIACIEQIEQNSEAQLLPFDEYRKIWDGESNESLFEFTFRRSDNEGFAKNEGLADRVMGYPYNTDRKDLSPLLVFSPQFLNLFSDNDRRIEMFENWGTTNRCFTTKYNKIVYTNAEKTNWESEATIVIFRLADMYLLKAEALLMKETPDNGKARMYLNMVRNRAGLQDYEGTDAQLYSEISDERTRELYMEGHRLYDWVRTGMYYQKSSVYSKERYDQEGYLHPVYSELLINNRLLQQTPYWRDKMAN